MSGTRRKRSSGRKETARIRGLGVAIEAEETAAAAAAAAAEGPLLVGGGGK
jgi:hypothetical protein